ncbi:hypothetical protein SCP_1302870 [Sparassis crispa]|uniref:DUF6570 domain-containing protein n=1 Tax=Sparassis crispa TaxID=139825 RepID=A0A401H210_9APHY|nr:hypothetical protein SCP_1302870 [Sparassis crispa]GBE88471.1 hypothetical protein SCP_1302870 [Sparassis crispa]
MKPHQRIIATDELQQLNFIEKLIVAHYRHNYFVVQVNMGQRKLSANAVVFPQPVERLHNILPPPREDLDKCLAVLFTGPCKPSPADYKCMPLLVRHTIILNALRWLRLNHCDYEDIQISHSNLASYSEEEPSVYVVHHPSSGSTPAASVASNDNELE